MSITGLDLRDRLRRRVVRGLDVIADLLDDPADEEGSDTPADVPPRQAAPPPPPEPPAPAAPLDPLPELNRSLKPAARPSRPEPTPPPPARVTASFATPAAEKASATPEDRQAAHWTRTREGVLRFVHESSGSATLRALHDYSEQTFFVAHVQFSKLMEELTDEGLLDYDHDTATATITEAGRAEIL